MSEAFVYCWTDHKNNKLYIGSHKGEICDGYICSSKYMLAEYEKRPYDFTRQIIAEGNIHDIRKLEAKILDTLNVKINENFYNQHNGNGDFYCKGHTEKTRQKMSKTRTGKKLNYKRTISEDHKNKLHEGRRNSKNSKEHNDAIRKYNLGKEVSYETRQKQKLAKLGKKFTQEHKDKIGKMDRSFMQTIEYKNAVKDAWVKRKQKKKFQELGGFTDAGK